MKATGIVRRIDDLGRIVVPKEIRRILKIEENDPVEIYTNENSDIVIKKYSVLSGWDNIAQQYAESLSNSTGSSVCISDNEKVLAVSGVSKKVFIGKKIDSGITDIIKNGETVILSANDTCSIIEGDENKRYNTQLVSPILSDGKAIGAIILFTDNDINAGDAERKIVQSASDFLGKFLGNQLN